MLHTACNLVILINEIAKAVQFVLLFSIDSAVLCAAEVWMYTFAELFSPPQLLHVLSRYNQELKIKIWMCI